VITRWEVLAYAARLPAGRGYVLRIHDESGCVGTGEARALQGFGSGPAALEAFIGNPDAVQSLLERPAAGAATPFEALFAVETAIADLNAQNQGVPLVEQLGFARPDALGNSLLVNDEAEALRLLGDGHRNFKLKAHGTSNDSMALLQCLHDASEGSAKIRIDANGSWNRDTALAFLQQAPDASISFLEQPFPCGDLDSCVWLRERVPVPIALDEGALTTEDIVEAARTGAAQVVVIKPMYRGLYGSLQLATIADGHDLGVCVTHAMDGTVGRLATMHVAAAIETICPDSSWPHGLYAPGLTNLADEPELQADRLRMPAGHGLGCHGLRLEKLEPVCASA